MHEFANETVASQRKFGIGKTLLSAFYQIDYMFRVILQKNQFVLKGLIASLLHLEHQNIKNIYITNPIKLGEQIDSKAFVMDIHVILNDDTLLNLEMQLLNTGNWVERSLSYLCRMYDQLQSGDDYAEANTAIHIGL